MTGQHHLQRDLSESALVHQKKCNFVSALSGFQELLIFVRTDRICLLTRCYDRPVLVYLFFVSVHHFLLVITVAKSLAGKTLQGVKKTSCLDRHFDSSLYRQKINLC